MTGDIFNMTHWNANLYDRAHKFVSTYGKDVIRLLHPKKNERILDIGCGTGDLTNEIFSMGAFVVGVDYSENMIQQAKKKYPKIDFQVKDILTLDYKNRFDAVFSNAVLHWVRQPYQALEEIYKSLHVGGRFVAEFGGKGNVQKIVNCIIEEKEKLGYSSKGDEFPWYNPSIGEYTMLMEKVGFTVVYAALLDRPTKLEGKDGLKNWLHMFGASLFKEVHQEEIDLLLTNVENSLKNDMFHSDHWIADYKRIRVKAVKID